MLGLAPYVVTTSLNGIESAVQVLFTRGTFLVVMEDMVVIVDSSL